jgi:hypothetical protein
VVDIILAMPGDTAEGSVARQTVESLNVNVLAFRLMFYQRGQPVVREFRK